MIPFITMMLVFLLGIYYATIFLHLMNVNIFGKDTELNIALSLIPFFYWLKKQKKNIEPPVVEEKVIKKTVVKETEKKKTEKKKNKK